jgi:hypothetical protein
MKASSVLTRLRRLLPLAALSLASGALAAPKCDQMSNDVRKAIASDPAKTLMVVEDALVINESCACEIVRAAIEASQADEALKQQIVQTALAVAPKMAPVITDCAGIAGTAAAPVASPVAYEDPTASGKNPSGKGAKEVLPVAPPVEDVQDFTYLPGDIRGVYLMAPGGVGIIGFDERRFRDSHDNDRDKGDKHKRTPPHRRITRPISRSVVATR